MNHRDSLFYRVRKKRYLEGAWRVVRSNARSSTSIHTRREAEDFAQDASRHLTRIQTQLRKNRFHFSPSRGAPIPRKGKAPRPLVVAPMVDRIVQRAILDVLQEQKHVAVLLSTATSFGGIKGRGVREALEAAYRAVNKGCRYFIRSDIKDFYQKIPRAEALDALLGPIDDQLFCDLTLQATETELINLEQLGASADLFPIHELGVAQGCCLSPLIGNTLLTTFDREMNGRGVVCLRFIDDFLLLGPNRRNVNSAFRSGLRLLGDLGLSAYEPGKDGKAAEGTTAGLLEFLGCEVRPGQIRPSRDARNRIVAKIRDILRDSSAAMRDPKRCVSRKLSVVQTLNLVSNTLEGWGNQYNFCNDAEVMESVDSKVDILLRQYLGEYGARRTALAHRKDAGFNRRRLLGVRLVSDCRTKPIISAKSK